MNTIYKFELKLTDRQIITTHNLAKFLDVQIQNGELQIKYISTVQEEQYVWHIFQEI